MTWARTSMVLRVIAPNSAGAMALAMAGFTRASADEERKPSMTWQRRGDNWVTWLVTEPITNLLTVMMHAFLLTHSLAYLLVRVEG